MQPLHVGIDRGQVGMFMPIGTLPDGNAARKKPKIVTGVNS
jgi:hypothetical protein